MTALVPRTGGEFAKPVGVGEPTQQKCNPALAAYATQNPFDGGELKPFPGLSVHSDSPGRNGAPSGPS